MFIKGLAKYSLCVAVFPFFAIVGVVFSIIARGLNSRNAKPRLVWGSTPVINNRYWSQAMRLAGYQSETYTYQFYSAINSRSDWDRLLEEEWKFFPRIAKPLLAFLWSLLNYDIFFISADGFFIGNLPVIWRLQSPLLRLAGKKVVFIPYGGDAYVYRRIRSTSLLNGLLASYPMASRQQDQIEAKLDYWCRYSDACIPAVMGMDGFGRWDVVIPSVLFINLDEWKTSQRSSIADGRGNGVVTVCHAPNHRGFKGTEFLMEIVKQLQAEGLKVELILMEKIQNEQVRTVLRSQADILVEQIICTGYGMNGLEGLACGLPVISNLEDDNYVLPMRRWSYFSECPIVSASPESLVNVLRELIVNPELRRRLGEGGRKYVEKYHGLDSAAYLFTEVIEYVYERRESLINLYHPLLGDYPNRLPLLQHPLVNNRIVGK